MTHNQIPIMNFWNVSEKISMGGQPKPSQYKFIKEGGYTVVFQLIVKEAAASINDEAFHLRTVNLKHEVMHISFANPTEEDVYRFVEIMDKYVDEKVYAHCAAGYCTAGLMVIYLMLRRGMSLEQAIDSITFEWQPTAAWQGLMRTFASKQQIMH